MRVFVSVDSIDFRNGIDGIAQICRNLFSEDPMNGSIFVFRAKNRTSIKLLMYDGQGFWLSTKRLSSGKFRWWPNNPQMSAKELGVLIFNGNPHDANFQNEWRKIA
jgi:transposase